MDQNTSSSPLFGLTFDQTTRNHLGEAARWAKFIAIVGFIGCGLAALFGIFMSSADSWTDVSGRGGYGYNSDRDARYNSTIIAMAGGFYVGMAVLAFFAYLFLYNFATKAKAALASNNQELMNISMQNLKKMFRFIGILTIIVLVIWGLGLIMMIIGLAAGGIGGGGISSLNN